MLLSDRPIGQWAWTKTAPIDTWGGVVVMPRRGEVDHPGEAQAGPMTREAAPARASVIGSARARRPVAARTVIGADHHTRALAWADSESESVPAELAGPLERFARDPRPIPR
jgi:hypothetical protein